MSRGRPKKRHQVNGPLSLLKVNTSIILNNSIKISLWGHQDCKNAWVGHGPKSIGNYWYSPFEVNNQTKNNINIKKKKNWEKNWKSFFSQNTILPFFSLNLSLDIYSLCCRAFFYVCFPIGFPGLYVLYANLQLSTIEPGKINQFFKIFSSS